MTVTRRELRVEVTKHGGQRVLEALGMAVGSKVLTWSYVTEILENQGKGSK